MAFHCKTINSFKILNININLFQSVYVNIGLCDINHNIVDVKTYIIEGDEYNKWNDDSYLIEWIKNKIKCD